MSDIDWSKAPEGATHYDTRGHCCSIGFMKPGVRRGEWEYFGMDGHWILYGLLDRDIQDAMVEAPKIPTWSGEGLPPVGTACEFKAGHSQFPELSWTKVRIIGHDRQGGKDFAVFSSVSGYGGCSDPADFRPIRTPEQIAAEEREKAINEMLALDPYLPNATLGMMSRADFCRALYDAGYRRVEQ